MLMEDHFIQRIKERYNIDLTLEEYYFYNSQPYEKVGNTQQDKLILITIKGTLIYAVRRRGNKMGGLLTALPFKQYIIDIKRGKAEQSNLFTT